MCAILTTRLTEKIYYTSTTLLELIKIDFELVESGPWVELYRNKENGMYWRLDAWDKFQEQYFVKIDDPLNWKDFDALELKIALLKKTRGVIEKTCLWSGCNNKALSRLVFCERHAFIEMGIRR